MGSPGLARHCGGGMSNGLMPSCLCQFVDRGFDGEQRLRQAVAPEGAGRHGVGVGDDGIDLLVRAVIDAERFADGMKQHRRGMIAIGAGVGEHVELQRGEFSVLVGAGLDRDAHRMPRRGGDELFLAGELEFDRAPGLERGQRQDVLDEHFLLAAKTAADTLAEHPDLLGRRDRRGPQARAGSGTASACWNGR